jgi:hypothetical protein
MLIYTNLLDLAERLSHDGFMVKRVLILVIIFIQLVGYISACPCHNELQADDVHHNAAHDCSPVCHSQVLAIAPEISIELENLHPSELILRFISSALFADQNQFSAIFRPPIAHV